MESNVRYRLLIRLTGKKQSGKTHIANYLQRKEDFQVISMADPLKRAVEELFGLSYEDSHNENKKEIINPRYGMSPRQLWQLIGTDGLRNKWPDLFVDRFNETLNLSIDTKVIVPDIIFEKEAEAIRARGGKIIRVIKEGCKEIIDSHKSELSTNLIKEDYTISAPHGQLEKLFSGVLDILKGME